ncbi:methyl-accepting chemotaxis protein [Vreelandella malpeensis]|uniref:Tar ligand binding domain-containing protein n=1 Tax=Vreelandella malpeensis TaxID=1172368 RepID=A0ABS8DSI3_9GAMM|nr:methyl-accepting chemotaxis protein [Halomonas malpeensis]MCB8889231.1 Tar ligand binding domain-containing protein [Halomonas malpeensis]
MKNLSVKTLISTALILLLGMIIITGTLAIRSELESIDKLSEINQISAVQANDANRLKAHLMEVRLRLARMVLHNMGGNADRAANALDQARDNLVESDTLVEYLRLADDAPAGEHRDLLHAITTAFDSVMTPPLRQAMAAGDYAELDRLRDGINESFPAFSDAVDRFSVHALQYGETLIEDERQDSKVSMLVVGTLLAVGVALFIAMQLLVNRLIVAPLQHAAGVCEGIAQGDLTHRLEPGGRNEVGRFYNALADMQSRLEGIIGTLSQSGEAVASSSKQIAGGSQDLASRTEQQAAALQQTAASMDEISSLVRQNAETASEAERLTQDAAGKVARGQQTSERTTQLMRELEATSHRVHDIVQVIDSIAFQTNILALNASVEAARAGEHGRGFAVVASEVRSLATKTSSSSKEIRAMIEDIAQRIAQGAEQSAHSRHDMEEINGAIMKVNDMMQSLAMAAKEQDAGISQVSTAVAQMDSATQENVSLVEETSTASAALEDEASRLAELVGTFKLNQTIERTLPRQKAAPLHKPASRAIGEPEWEAF